MFCQYIVILNSKPATLLKNIWDHGMFTPVFHLFFSQHSVSIQKLSKFPILASYAASFAEQLRVSVVFCSSQSHFQKKTGLTYRQVSLLPAPFNTKLRCETFMQKKQKGLHRCYQWHQLRLCFVQVSVKVPVLCMQSHQIGPAPLNGTFINEFINPTSFKHVLNSCSFRDGALRNVVHAVFFTKQQSGELVSILSYN